MTVSLVHPAPTESPLKISKLNNRSTRDASTARMAPWARPAPPAEPDHEACAALLVHPRCRDVTLHPDHPERWDHLALLARTDLRERLDHQAMMQPQRRASRDLRASPVNKDLRDQLESQERMAERVKRVQLELLVTPVIKVPRVVMDQRDQPEKLEKPAKMRRTARARHAVARPSIRHHAAGSDRKWMVVLKKLVLLTPSMFTCFDYYPL